jgi:hypothetical protein
MPSYPPPLPPGDYPLDMPEPPAYSPSGGRLFQFEDGEDLNAEEMRNGRNEKG